ncbi:hypothetical protein V6C32_10845 [Desulforamulus ruminis]|uniref:hypothetical protein n=1 Tax=Desulforamulus ruminis TaxID=1564 RepID=UPI002FDB5EA4
MIHNLLMTLFMWICWILGIVLFCAVLIFSFKTYHLQRTADYIAESEGKFGGYTTQAHEELLAFAEERNFDLAKMEVEVSAPDEPVPWGTPVSAVIRYDYEMKVLKSLPAIHKEIQVEGWDISRYVAGKYAVTYTSP